MTEGDGPFDDAAASRLLRRQFGPNDQSQQKNVKSTTIR